MRQTHCHGFSHRHLRSKFAFGFAESWLLFSQLWGRGEISSSMTGLAHYKNCCDLTGYWCLSYYKYPISVCLLLLNSIRSFVTTWTSIGSVSLSQTGKSSRSRKLYFSTPRDEKPVVAGVSYGEAASVPIARGKYLYPYRTQQSSLSAVTILGAHPWENSTVPFYIKRDPKGSLFIYSKILVLCTS